MVTTVNVASLIIQCTLPTSWSITFQYTQATSRYLPLAPVQYLSHSAPSKLFSYLAMASYKYPVSWPQLVINTQQLYIYIYIYIYILYIYYMYVYILCIYIHIYIICIYPALSLFQYYIRLSYSRKNPNKGGCWLKRLNSQEYWRKSMWTGDSKDKFKKIEISRSAQEKLMWNFHGRGVWPWNFEGVSHNLQNF